MRGMWGEETIRLAFILGSLYTAHPGRDAKLYGHKVRSVVGSKDLSVATYGRCTGFDSSSDKLKVNDLSVIWKRTSSASPTRT